MLNIGKLAHDAAEYYLETVASGLEDYFSTPARRPPNGWERGHEPWRCGGR
jgi:hypothetical protein